MGGAFHGHLDLATVLGRLGRAAFVKAISGTWKSTSERSWRHPISLVALAKPVSTAG